MSTGYPAAVDTTATLKNDATDATVTAVTHAAQHDNVADAILAIETELGTVPKGTYTDVKTRLNDGVYKTPASVQTIRPSTDIVPLAVRKNTGSDTANLSEWRDHLNAILAFIDTTGVLSAQGLKIAGTSLASSHLSDGKSIVKKDRRFALMHIEGVTPGLTGDPQLALKITGNSTFTLQIAAGSGYIQGDDNIAQSMYLAEQVGATTLPLPTTTGGLTSGQSRIDAICVRYNDSLYTGRTPADTFEFIQVTGTAGVGNNLTNLTGKPAIPASALLLAYTVISFGDVGVAPANVSDQRKLDGPGLWGEDGHRYRIGIDANGVLGTEQVV